MIECSRFFETLSNLGFEYFYFDTINKERGKLNMQWLMLQVFSIYNYHSILEFQENPEEQEKLKELQISRIESDPVRNQMVVDFIQNSACLRKYSRNRVLECAHSFLRMILQLLELDTKEYNLLLEESKIGFFFSSLAQKQYTIMKLFIETNTENIHVIGVKTLSF